MKRFYCKPCGRMRRAQSWPADVVMTETPQGDLTPMTITVANREGTCWRHGRGRPLVRAARPVRAAKPVFNPPTIVKKSKGKGK